MTVIEIALIIIAIGFCIMVLTLIPAVQAAKRTAASACALHEMLHKELQPTIKELNAVLADMKTVGSGVAEHTDDVKRFMSALGETGGNLHTINRTVGTVTGVLNSTTAWVAGARVAGTYLLERYLKKRGGN